MGTFDNRHRLAMSTTAASATATAVAPVVPSYSVPATRYGRPILDFAAAPSLYVTEDLRQESFALNHRDIINEDLEAAEISESQAVANRRQLEAMSQQYSAAERAAAAAAAETREISRAAVAQRSALEAKYRDAEMAAAAAAAQCEEYRQMLISATAEQQRAEAEYAKAARCSEEAAADARACEFQAVNARLSNDECFAQRRALEAQAQRAPIIPSALASRNSYTCDGGFGGTASIGGRDAAAGAVASRRRSSRYY